MNKKYFVFGEKTELSKEQKDAVRIDQERRLKEGDDYNNQEAKRRLQEEDNLVHTEGRIVVKVDMQYKNSWKFEDGTVIRRERQFNEFNRRITEPVNAIVISGEGIPKDAEVLVDHNAFHETNRINDYKNSFEKEDSDRVRYFSLPRYECYAWRINGGEWNPIYPYEFGLRGFRKYNGSIIIANQEQLKDVLFVTTGNLKGKFVKTVKSADYCIVYQEANGRESHLICFRPYGDEKRKLEEEAIAIIWDLIDDYNIGNIFIGVEEKDAKNIFNEAIL